MVFLDVSLGRGMKKCRVKMNGNIGSKLDKTE